MAWLGGEVSVGVGKAGGGEEALFWGGRSHFGNESCSIVAFLEKITVKKLKLGSWIR